MFCLFNKIYLRNLSHLVLEKRAQTLNGHSEEFGEVGLTAGI